MNDLPIQTFKKYFPEWWSEIGTLAENRSNYTKNDSENKLSSKAVFGDTNSLNIPHVIDAVYCLAHALDIATHERSIAGNNSHKKQLELSGISFEGLTGKITFDKQGGR